MAEFVYDALGRRIRATYYDDPGVVSQDVLYYYDGQRVLAEFDYDEGSGQQTLARYFVDGATYVDEHLLMHDPNVGGFSGTDYYFVPRELHTVAGLVDENGAWVEVYAYDVYGAAQIYDALGTPLTASAIGNPYFFTGRRLELLSNASLPRAYRQLYHYRARAYDPLHGRFAQRDPAEYADGMNLYEYVRSRPSSKVDPRGLWIIVRDGQPKAVAEAEYEDTIEELADTIGLQADEWRKWITFDKILTQSSLIVGINSNQLSEKTRICPGQKVSIPNAILAYWAGEVGEFGKWWVRFEQDISTLQRRGFFVGRNLVPRPAAEVAFMILSGQKTKKMHGIFFWGHGIVREDEDAGEPKWDLKNSRKRRGVGLATDAAHRGEAEYQMPYSDLNPVYEMGVGILFACYTDDARDYFSDDARFWGAKGTLVPHGFHLFGPTVDEIVPPGVQGTRK